MLKNGISVILTTLFAVLVLSIGSRSSAQDWDMVYGDLILLKNAESMKLAEMGAVLFPHWFHRIRFRCKVCHEDIFKQNRGANDISMDTIIRGKHCGTCHDGRVAWEPLYCERCHVVDIEAIEQVSKQHTLEPHEVHLNKAVDPDDPTSIVYTGRKGTLASMGDPRMPSSDAFKWGLGWQPQVFKLDEFPKDKFGLVQWNKLAKRGFIRPKGAIDPKDPHYKEPVRFEYEDEDEDIEDIVIETKSNFVNDVKFPHTLHTWWLDCKSCHPSRFVRTAGDTEIVMKEMANGKYCGECHNKVSFPLADCTKCHTVKKGETEF